MFEILKLWMGGGDGKLISPNILPIQLHLLGILNIFYTIQVHFK